MFKAQITHTFAILFKTVYGFKQGSITFKRQSVYIIYSDIGGGAGPGGPPLVSHKQGCHIYTFMKIEYFTNLKTSKFKDAKNLKNMASLFLFKRKNFFSISGIPIQVLAHTHTHTSGLLKLKHLITLHTHTYCVAYSSYLDRHLKCIIYSITAHKLPTYNIDEAAS